VAVAEEHAAVETPAVQHRHLVVVPDHDEVDAGRSGVRGLSIAEIAPRRDPLGVACVLGAHRVGRSCGGSVRPLPLVPRFASPITGAIDDRIHRLIWYNHPVSEK
jgi:hypothetical protein